MRANIFKLYTKCDSIKISKLSALAITTLLSYFVFLLPTPAFSTEVLKLKKDIEVHDNIVTLGDIFDNMSRYRNEAIFKSPDLGRQGTVRIERLIEAAERYNFTFETPLSLKKIKISRPARTIKSKIIETLLKERIKTQNKNNSSKSLSKDAQLKLTFETAIEELMVPISYSGKMKITKLNYNKSYGTFEAVIQPIEAKNSNYAKRITGKTQLVILQPVLKRSIKKGDRINASDITLEEFTPRRIPRNAIKNKTEIIGMVASKQIRAGSFVRASDIETLKIIKKDQLVTLILQKPGMSLKTQGKALDGASLNETISIMNIHSKRIVHGIVKGPGLVLIQTNDYSLKLQKTAQLN